MAKIVDMYTIEVEQKDVGQKIDLRILAQTELDANALKDIIEKEIEIKLSKDKEALEERIRKQERERFATDLKLAQEATKNLVEKQMADEVNKAKIELESERAAVKSAEEKFKQQEQNFKQLLASEKTASELKAKEEAQKMLEKIKADLADKEAKAAELKAKLDASEKIAQEKLNAQKLEIEISAREKLEKEYRDEIDKLKAEKAVMANEKRSSNQKQYGNDFEDRVQAELQSAFRRDLVKKIVAGEEGADFVATVEKDGNNIGNILIECKNPQSNKIDKKWYEKLVKDGAKFESRYKLLVTQASENSADDVLPYWLQDPVNNIYVVRLEFVKLFVDLLSHIMYKEHSIEGLENAEEAMQKYTNLLNFKDAELPRIQKAMIERAKDIETKCGTIVNATEAIKTSARLMTEKDIKEIIKGIEKI